MGQKRGQRNRAREKFWPGQDAANVREAKRSGFEKINVAAGFSQGQGLDDPLIHSNPAGDEAAATPNIDRLREHIAIPDWRERIVPLAMFRGNGDAYRLRAMQNVAYGMFLAENSSYRDGIKQFMPHGVGHECGIHSEISIMSLRQIFCRMRGSKKFTNSISKAFTEYVEWIHPAPCVLMPVSLIAPRGESHFAWWRKAAPHQLRLRRQAEIAASVLQYPFIRGEPKSKHEQLLQVHGLIPPSIKGDLRADLCQDLFVALLSGELTIDQVPGQMREFAKQARETSPEKWRNVSLTELDERLGIDGETYLDLVSHTPNFLHSLCDVIHEHEEESGVPAAHWVKEGIVTRPEDANPRMVERSRDSAVYVKAKPREPHIIRGRIRHERPHWKMLRSTWGDG